VTRFILICNYVTRIIEPLASRCAKFRFASLPPASMHERLTYIAHQEQCGPVTLSLLDGILDLADGDMRRAVTTLQSVHSLYGRDGIALDEDDRDTILAEMAGLPPKAVVDALWASMTHSTFAVMEKGMDDVIASGYSGQMLLAGLLQKIMEEEGHFSELHQAEVAIRIAESEKNMIEGADEYLQLLNVGALVLDCQHKTRTAAIAH
jgi:replication factor C subunit 2/4